MPTCPTSPDPRTQANAMTGDPIETGLNVGTLSEVGVTNGASLNLTDGLVLGAAMKASPTIQLRIS
jgi:hypothetical protein